MGLLRNSSTLKEGALWKKTILKNYQPFSIKSLHYRTGKVNSMKSISKNIVPFQPAKWYGIVLGGPGHYKTWMTYIAREMQVSLCMYKKK